MTGLPSPGDALLRFEPLTEGVLLKRYKRFLADVELSSGETVTAHCANTGPMTGVLIPGQRVRLRYAPSPKRKLAWTWEQAEVPGADGAAGRADRARLRVPQRRRRILDSCDFTADVKRGLDPGGGTALVAARR